MFSFAKKLVDRFEGHEGPQDSYFKNLLDINNRGYALRVLAVTPQSPANVAGLEAWFDYITGINGHTLPMAFPSLGDHSYSINNDGTINYGGSTTAEHAGAVNFDLIHQELVNVCRNPNTNKEVVLDVWSAKGGVLRQVRVPLSQENLQESTENTRKLIPDPFQAIGLTLQSQHINTATYVWRILATHVNSPAFQAQLVPYSDYIIGCDSAFPDDAYGKGLLAQGGEALLSQTVSRYYNFNSERSHEDFVPITLYVYNHDYDVLRPVTVNLTRTWGDGSNKGLLGCDVGYGLLHRIPEVVGKFDSEKLTDDVLYESKDVEFQLPPPGSDTFTPAADAFTLAAPLAPPKPGKKKKHTRPVADLNEYMNEELQKSKEADTSTVKPVEGSVAPPPKSSS
ncbi:hypothetical protein PSN45_003095 [Yamadazyma tenuis]|uniref:PDZ GRASP-type domain-containing protein n=1 Tax=Candida tenuis (strain ATCC 10573 / BCRC 21748 / CBS 615 / JCM 9827 / NBRC 10315 / NRRL Y-1498 / VKM Y-70) TaxID=590646 RepID=G3AZF0_CANTC|nr:uncharacterized protein CANTEDRAFT_112940 [Yamadazyma tenuis ATCC 10573]XP_006684880.1 uncharacterized protein CANTEDRAFT_112940 [Yamadazyma tenuis ATCC 10573]EGV66305.1 hypothetical protein CANTEDRAFT_112940 [Yamadazyma tenuis ATCC 10573]EGV66306.1 hypothetical protein CANTEDRAFT_112940 [Yamadazyma tenuis ATCC 10573]WEJ95572.1 hypothetical protein PSN45_003095 [Yamadazyma tenuis]